MQKGIQDIMAAIGGEADGTQGAKPKKRMVYVDEEVYNRLMSSGEAVDAEPETDPMAEDDTMDKTVIAKTDPLNEGKGDISSEDDETMPEGIDFDDDEDDEAIKRIGRLFGGPAKAKMKGV